MVVVTTASLQTRRVCLRVCIAERLGSRCEPMLSLVLVLPPAVWIKTQMEPSAVPPSAFFFAAVLYTQAIMDLTSGSYYHHANKSVGGQKERSMLKGLPPINLPLSLESFLGQVGSTYGTSTTS